MPGSSEHDGQNYVPMFSALAPSNEEMQLGKRGSIKSTGSSVKIDQAKNVIRKNSGSDQNLAGLSRLHPTQSVEKQGLAIVDEAEAE